MSVRNVCTVQVEYHDPKRTLSLYECCEEDHLAVQEWLDRHLRGDYLFKKNHLKNIITRPTATLFAILFDGMYVGTAIVYAGSVLHNIMIADEFRSLGIGEAVIRYLAPGVIRAKTNMQAGDPVPFYKKLGYEPVGVDPNRPHIVVMTPQGAPVESSPTCSPLPVSPSHLAAPPEMSDAERDAAKWRALKARQRERQARRKSEKAAEDAAAAAVHLKPSLQLQSLPNGLPTDYRYTE